MSFVFVIIAYLGSAVCLSGAYQQGKRVLEKLPDSEKGEAFAGSLSRVFSLHKDPEIRKLQGSLIKWIAGAILLLTIARYGQILSDNPKPASNASTQLKTEN